MKSLQQNGQRELAVVGTDMSARRGGRSICDAFHVVPPGSSDEFPGHLAELARREGVDVVFPLSSFEVAAVSRAVDQFDVPVLVASPAAIAACNDKAADDGAVRAPRRPDPALDLPRPPDEFRAAAARARLSRTSMSARSRPRSRARAASSCSRRSPTVAGTLLEARPGPIPLTLDEALEAIGDDDFPPLLVMDYAEGQGAHGRRRSAAAAGSWSATPRRARPCAPAWPCTSRLPTSPSWSSRRARSCAELGRGLVRERAVHRRPPARDQPAHLDDRLPGGLQHALPGCAACAGRDRRGRARPPSSRACG